MDVESAADELYGIDPDEFLAARTALVAKARAAKDRPLASALGALRKPTRSAWLVNLLARDAPDRLRQLGELAERMAAAHQSLDMAALRTLGVERQQLIDAITARAVAAGAEHGYQATEAVRGEVSQTLAAAVADPESRADVLAGRVVKAHVYSGFGFPLAASPAAVTGSPTQPRAETPDATDEPTADVDAPRRASESARRRAQEVVDAATAALVQARATLKEARSADAEAHERLDRAAHEVADLRAELRAAESAELAARQSANEAADRLHEALGAVQQAEQTLSAAARALGAAG